MHVPGVPKTSLRLDLLEGSANFRKAIMLMIMVYYRKWIQIKIRKKKRHMEWRHQEEAAWASRCPHLVQSQGQLLPLPSVKCDNMRQVLPIREAHLRLGTRVSLGINYVGIQGLWPPWLRAQLRALKSSDGQEPACKAGDADSIPGSRRSPGERNGNLLRYSCLENPMDRGAWWATLLGVAKSWTWLSN